MSTETKSPPPPGATAIKGLAAPACAQAQTAVIGAAAAVAAGIAPFIPRRRRAGSRRGAARAHRRGDDRTGSAPRPMT
jgi:hypothetical protein